MFLLFVLGSLLLAPQVVFASNLRFSFAQVDQCAPVSLSIQGILPSSAPVPTNLLVLPFNATPISIPVPSTVANSSGVNITFLPLAENTTFIASLNSASGENSALVSDIFKVFPPVSPGNDSCVPSQPFSPTFRVDDDVSQCEDFAVTYSHNSAPSVRLFNPRGDSYPLKKTTDDGKSKATYTMVAFRGTQVLLLLDDGNGNTQTSPLLNVNGDASSSKSCFPHQQTNTQSKPASSAGVSMGTIIGLSVGLGIAALLAVPLTWYAIRERRRRRQRANRGVLDPSGLEKASYDNPYVLKRDYTRSPSPPSLSPNAPSLPPPPPPFFSGYPGYNTEGFVKDPAYVSEMYSPTISEHLRTSISWEGDRRESSDGYQSPLEEMRRASNEPTILSSSNIEKMLDLAARNSGLLSPKSALSEESFEPAPVNPPAAAHTSSRDRQPSNVPQNMSFLADSTFYEGAGVLYDSPRSMGSMLRPESDVQPKF